MPFSPAKTPSSYALDFFWEFSCFVARGLRVRPGVCLYVPRPSSLLIRPPRAPEGTGFSLFLYSSQQPPMGRYWIVRTTSPTRRSIDN